MPIEFLDARDRCDGVAPTASGGLHRQAVSRRQTVRTKAVSPTRRPKAINASPAQVPHAGVKTAPLAMSTIAARKARPVGDARSTQEKMVMRAAES